MTQLTDSQAWALHELATGGRFSARTHTRTIRVLMRLGYATPDYAGWRLTSAGQAASDRAKKLLERRAS